MRASAHGFARLVLLSLVLVVAALSGSAGAEARNHFAPMGANAVPQPSDRGASSMAPAVEFSSVGTMISSIAGHGMPSHSCSGTMPGGGDCGEFSHYQCGAGAVCSMVGAALPAVTMYSPPPKSLPQWEARALAHYRFSAARAEHPPRHFV